MPLLTDDAGNVYAATTTYPDGREALVLTFAQATYVFHTLAARVRPGQLGDARGVRRRAPRLPVRADRRSVPGEHDLPGTGATYRMTDHDMQALADWQTARRADPLVAGLRLAWAANLQGSRGVANDPLTAKAVELGPTFAWISHTWDHADMTNMSYADAYSEFSQNDQTIRAPRADPVRDRRTW